MEAQKREHGRWLDILERAFNKRGFTTIREGKIFGVKGWKEPDFFVLQGNHLFLVLEVIVAEGYRVILSKLKKINRRYNPKRIVVFEPVEYLDKELLPERKEHYKRYYLGHYPASYREIEEYFKEKWRNEEGIEVLFWDETTYLIKISELQN